MIPLGRKHSVMANSHPLLTERPAWKALKEHLDRVRGVSLWKLFADDPGRGERLALETAETLNLFYSWRRSARLTWGR